MAVRGEDDLPAHGAPFPQQEQGGVWRVPVSPRHAAGVDLQQRSAGVNGVKRLQRCFLIAGGGFVEESVSSVELGDEIQMPQNGGLSDCHPHDLLKISFRHGQSIPAAGIVPAGEKGSFVPVGGVAHAVLPPLIVRRADPVVEALRQNVGLAVPLQPQQHLHPAAVLLPHRQNLTAVFHHVRRQRETLVRSKGRVAVAGHAVIPHPCVKGGGRHGFQRIPAVAEVGVGVDGTGLGRQGHCIRSCLTL